MQSIHDKQEKDMQFFFKRTLKKEFRRDLLVLAMDIDHLPGYSLLTAQTLQQQNLWGGRRNI